MECLLKVPMDITLLGRPCPKARKAITPLHLLQPEVSSNGLVGQGTCLPLTWRDTSPVDFILLAVLVRLAFSYTLKARDTTHHLLHNTPLIMILWLSKVTHRTTTPCPHLRFNLLTVCPST